MHYVSSLTVVAVVSKTMLGVVVDLLLLSLVGGNIGETALVNWYELAADL